ncbi:hypothetical protein JVT61DRAFT_4329 [Boletus reticuloceps]|uniref:Uncharacterized protein n=1 Tax=Boletus reticuloceps TaxID=495285 RepID=A0A8I2YLX0_9AGAM|nr:hypothetical protein JVT61DRAFT_4329 [Boletus reticuloceps]
MVALYDIVPLKTGVALEVATSRPEQEHRCTRVAFCLHPWSRLGGCMYDPTVQTIVKCLQDNDFFVVYYNSRGVGQSTGWPSFNGKTEGSDLEALVQQFLEGHPQVKSVTFIVRRPQTFDAAPRVTLAHQYFLRAAFVSSWTEGTLDPVSYEGVLFSADSPCCVMTALGCSLSTATGTNLRVTPRECEMPLPDERPRQSVANLIGRFEQQGKRQASPAVPVVPRSSSVSSQVAGDAAGEEVKEKREWPPKHVASADIKQPVPPLSSSPSSSMSNPPVVSPQPTPDPAPSADIPTTPSPKTPELVMSPPSKGKPVAAGKSIPAAGMRRAAASTQKNHTPVANSTSTKSSVSSPPKTSLQSSVSQPLRSQHTGQSVTLNPSTTRQARSVPRTAPSTPSRPKSSISHNQAVTRPKTPSSGLFAPTAASLARSRNAPPPPPPPIKKVTLSSDAAERLSKPTAASLSKARTPVHAAPSPARVAKFTSATTHSTPPRGLSKLKAGRTPVKPQEASTKGEIKSDRASVSSEPPRGAEHLAADHTENGHETGAAALSDVGSPEDTPGRSEVVSDATHDPAAVEEARSDPGVYPEPPEEAGKHLAEDEAHDHEHVAQAPPEEVAHEHMEQVHPEVHLEIREDPVPEPAESHAGEVVSNGDGLKVEVAASGNDIEDIVNLLEGTSLSKPRPQSIVSIPDEDGEILDAY